MADEKDVCKRNSKYIYLELLQFLDNDSEIMFKKYIDQYPWLLDYNIHEHKINKLRDPFNIKYKMPIFHVAVNKNKLWAVEFLLKIGIKGFDSSCKYLPILEALHNKDDEMFKLLTKYIYTDCDDYKLCYPVLMQLLNDCDFEKFEYFKHAINLDIVTFLQTPFTLSYPFFIFCQLNNYETINYLLQNYSLEQLYIKNYVEKNLKSSDDCLPYKFIFTHYDNSAEAIVNTTSLQITDEEISKKCIENPEQEIVWAIIEEINMDLHMLSNFCYDIKLCNYKIFKNLLEMGYLGINALSYHGERHMFLALYYAHIHEDFENVKFITKTLKTKCKDINVISFLYALKTYHERAIHYYMCHFPQQRLTQSLPKKYIPHYHDQCSNYGKTNLLGYICKDVDNFKKLKDIYINGQVSTNHKYKKMDPNHILYFYDKTYKYDCQIPLYTVISAFICLNSMHKETIFNELLKVMFAAGEEFPCQDIKHLYLKYFNGLEKIYICPFRGPGNKSWLSHIYDDHASKLYDPFPLSMHCRHNIRKYMLNTNLHLNFYTEVKRLGLPNPIQSFLLYDQQPVSKKKK